MLKIIITLILLISLTTSQGQPSRNLVSTKYFLTKSNWYTDQTLKNGETLTFIKKSGKSYIKNQEAYYKFNSDSIFLWRTTIDKSQQAKAGYDFWLFKGQWLLKDNGTIISLKVDKENNFKDTYQILKLTTDTLVLKLLFVPGQ
jgi:hypothetical protein